MSEFFEVFNPAWKSSMSEANIKAGFKRTGIYPVNKYALPSKEFDVCSACKLIHFLNDVDVCNTTFVDLIVDLIVIGLLFFGSFEHDGTQEGRT